MKYETLHRNNWDTIPPPRNKDKLVPFWFKIELPAPLQMTVSKKYLTMEHKTPPHILTNAGLSIFVNTLKLRELSLPIEEIDIKDFLWHFDMPVWEKDGTDNWNLTPWEVIKKRQARRTIRKELKMLMRLTPLLLLNTIQD